MAEVPTSERTRSALKGETVAKSAPEVAQQMRKDPAKANYVSSGTGFASHILVELLKREAKSDTPHIPVRGVGAAMEDLLSDPMSFPFPLISVAVPQAKSGKIRLLVIASEKEAQRAQIPDVLTFAELCLPKAAPRGYWIATYVPSGCDFTAGFAGVFGGPLAACPGGIGVRSTRGREEEGPTLARLSRETGGRVSSRTSQR